MKRLAMLLLLSFFLCTPCFGADVWDIKKALPEEAREVLTEIDPDQPDAKAGFSALWKWCCNHVREKLKIAFHAAFQITAVCILLSLLKSFAESAGVSLPSRIPDLAGATAILLLALDDGGTLVEHCRQTVNQLDLFTKTLTTVFAVASATAGKPVTAVASAGATLLFSDLLLSLTQHLFLPAVTWYLLLQYMGTISENNALRQAAVTGKWGITTFFKLFLTAYFVYLTFTGLVSGSADAAAIKTAQSLSSAVPFVGSVISSASGTFLAGANLLRAGVGLFGFLGALAICLSPLLAGVCHFLVFRLLSIFASSFAEGGTKVMLDAISSAYSMLLGILISCCAIQFIAIVVSMTVGSI